LYPGVPLDLAARQYEREDEDGVEVLEFKAGAVSVTAGGIKVFEVSEGAIAGFVTASRFVVVCERHTDDEQQLRMFPNFVASGHIRWPWLALVGTSPPSGGFRRQPERLQLRTTEATSQAATGKVRHMALTLVEPTIPADELADEIYQRAIRYRLANEPGTKERGWDRLLTAPERQSAGKFSFSVVPEFHYARAEMPAAYRAG
jgi:hypothetical protein